MRFVKVFLPGDCATSPALFDGSQFSDCVSDLFLRRKTQRIAFGMFQQIQFDVNI